jgi:hypothetical protein
MHKPVEILDEIEDDSGMPARRQTVPIIPSLTLPANLEAYDKSHDSEGFSSSG